LLGPDLPDVVDVAAEQRLDLLAEVLDLVFVLDLAGQKKGDAGPAGHVDRFARSLVARHPAEPAVVPAASGADRKSLRLDAVMDHSGDRNRAGGRGLMM
jgi:hypothetical protein